MGSGIMGRHGNPLWITFSLHFFPPSPPASPPCPRLERTRSVLEIGLINVAALDAPLTVLAQQKPNRRRGGGEEEERKKGDLFIAAKKSRIVSRCVIALHSLRRIGQC